MRLTVTNIVKETSNSVSVSFKNGSLFNRLKYLPGQFATFHFKIADEIHKRAYSFSSNPTSDKDLRITVKRVEKGLVSNFINETLEVGDKIEVEKPTGSFYITTEKKRAQKYVFFAGGSGITPIYSIVRDILLKEPNSKVLLIYANKTLDQIIFKKKIEALEREYPSTFSVSHLVSYAQADHGKKYRKSLVTDSLVVELLGKYEMPFEDSRFMICGPFGFMEAVKSILTVNGTSPTNIKVELFKRAEVVIKNEKMVSQVEIQMNGESYRFDVANNKSILQTALSNNVALPYSCRSGMCSTCKASCISGEINMIDGHVLADSEVNAGRILTCISYPDSENVVIAI